MINKTEITILKRIENRLIIAVTGAKGTLKCQRLPKEENREELTIPMVMTLNEIPIVQMSPNYCPTCCGLLATGYGIDNANCSELLKISDYINSEFRDLESLTEKIKPLIGLLEDGIYLIRDIKTFPTDGNNNFFWNVSNKPEYYRAFTDAYYISEILETANIDGVFLYPTQSPEKYNEQRVQYYMDLFSRSDNPPRAIAYNAMRGMSALLDGHHKACATARLHKPLDTIMITPGRLCNDQHILYAEFGYYNKDLHFTIDNNANIPDVLYKSLNNTFKNNSIYYHNIVAGRFTERKWENCYQESVKFYPTAEQYAVDLILQYNKIYDMTEDEIYQYILRQENPQYYAEMILHYLYRHHLNQINPILKKIINVPVNGETSKIIGTALRYLMNLKNEETEKICLEFVIGDNEYLADIAKDYWADEE